LSTLGGGLHAVFSVVASNGGKRATRWRGGGAYRSAAAGRCDGFRLDWGREIGISAPVRKLSGGISGIFSADGPSEP